jgi:hypothetical protein
VPNEDYDERYLSTFTYPRKYCTTVQRRSGLFDEQFVAPLATKVVSRIGISSQMAVSRTRRSGHSRTRSPVSDTLLTATLLQSRHSTKFQFHHNKGWNFASGSAWDSELLLGIAALRGKMNAEAIFASISGRPKKY